jgi:hypothetical protein
MSEHNVRVRVKFGANEAEIEAPKSDLKELVEFVPELMKKVGVSRAVTDAPSSSSTQELPEVRFDKGESLPSMIVKVFNSSWGRQPRKLQEVRETLETFGLVYPKQSVAVALLRLVKDSKLRRFKRPDGEFVYTLSTNLLSPGQGAELVQEEQSEMA